MRLIAYAVAALAALAAAAAPANDAKTLYQARRYHDAIAIANAALRSNPRDGNANYYLGASYYALHEYDKARGPLAKAVERGVADAPALLAEIDYMAYDFDAAAAHIEKWESLLERNKKDIPDRLEDMRQRVILARNMMQRVESVEIVDSVNVSAYEFFNNYVLSADAGRLLDGSALPQGQLSATNMAYIPASGKQVLWSSPAPGPHSLMTVDILDDGSYGEPRRLGDDLGGGGDADYPFLCADGLTFYFAANGEGSLGGYDIFMSRFDSDGNPLQPQNIGMPYNSPANDYMLVLDETNGLGWWATDRLGIDGVVTIYTFRINDSRVNVPSDSPDLVARASLSGIEIDPDGRELIAALDQETVEDDDTAEFSFTMPDGRLCTRYSDLGSDQARQAMRQLLQRDRDLADINSRLSVLRARYAAGDKSVSQEILNLERRVLADPPIRSRLVNTIVSAGQR